MSLLHLELDPEEVDERGVKLCEGLRAMVPQCGHHGVKVLRVERVPLAEVYQGHYQLALLLPVQPSLEMREICHPIEHSNSSHPHILLTNKFEHFSTQIAKCQKSSPFA